MLLLNTEMQTSQSLWTGDTVHISAPAEIIINLCALQARKNAGNLSVYVMSILVPNSKEYIFILANCFIHPCLG